jgi:alkylhydroperoxidase family enzyme
MKDTEETAPPAYREELENCFLAIAEAVNDLRRDGYDSDQIAEALRFIAATATRQLAAGWQAALAKELRS